MERPYALQIKAGIVGSLLVASLVATVAGLF